MLPNGVAVAASPEESPTAFLNASSSVRGFSVRDPSWCSKPGWTDQGLSSRHPGFRKLPLVPQDDGQLAGVGRRGYGPSPNHPGQRPRRARLLLRPPRGSAGVPRRAGADGEPRGPVLGAADALALQQVAAHGLQGGGSGRCHGRYRSDCQGRQ